MFVTDQACTSSYNETRNNFVLDMHEFINEQEQDMLKQQQRMITNKITYNWQPYSLTAIKCYSNLKLYAQLL